MGGLPVMQWLNNAITKIQNHTSRPIIVRAHPGDKRSREYLKVNKPGVRISTNPSILQDFKKCHAVVTFNSSPGVAAAVEGIPIFVTDPNPNERAHDVANTDLAKINEPDMFEREKWLEKLACVI